MQADKGLQFERTELAQRRTVLLCMVVIVASMKFVVTALGGMLAGLLMGNMCVACATLWALSAKLVAAKKMPNFGHHFRARNAVMCLCVVQIALNLLCT